MSPNRSVNFSWYSLNILFCSLENFPPLWIKTSQSALSQQPRCVSNNCFKSLVFNVSLQTHCVLSLLEGLVATNTLYIFFFWRENACKLSERKAGLQSTDDFCKLLLSIGVRVLRSVCVWLPGWSWWPLGARNWGPFQTYPAIHGHWPLPYSVRRGAPLWYFLACFIT